MDLEWKKVANFSTGFEADMARVTLENAEILVQLRGNGVGAFGGSFQGTVIGGVDVYVPAEDADEARELLGITD